MKIYVLKSAYLTLLEKIIFIKLSIFVYGRHLSGNLGYAEKYAVKYAKICSKEDGNNIGPQKKKDIFTKCQLSQKGSTAGCGGIQEFFLIL